MCWILLYILFLFSFSLFFFASFDFFVVEREIERKRDETLFELSWERCVCVFVYREWQWQEKKG